jgi:hypothetical protein
MFILFSSSFIEKAARENLDDSEYLSGTWPVETSLPIPFNQNSGP